MKARLFTIAVSVLAVFSTPALAADAGGDLPFTPAFADAVSAYHMCVIGALDRNAVARPEAMAAAAVAACDGERSAVRVQLIADISAARPHDRAKANARAAQAGMARVTPMIAAAALDHAREMVGAASSENKRT